MGSSRNQLLNISRAGFSISKGAKKPDSFIKRISKRTFKGVGGVFIFGAGFTAYHYPELRKDPMQMARAMRRGLRAVTTGTLMASDYL